jgi:XTP/dITP diphosphohydrolase
MQTFVLASRNRDKIEELRSTLDIFDDIRLKSSLDFPALEKVEEDLDTLEGNALKKARYTFQAIGLPALSDDTGLEVDALAGQPGVYSARYASENATYQENMKKLLAELTDVALKDRGAQFRTVVAFVTEDGTHTFEGVCRGTILTERRGEKGFGYDPLFQPERYEETFAELDSAVKNGISHRGKAIKKFTTWLEEDYLSSK